MCDENVFCSKDDTPLAYLEKLSYILLNYALSFRQNYELCDGMCQLILLATQSFRAETESGGQYIWG